jgi:hypothetical protein
VRAGVLILLIIQIMSIQKNKPDIRKKGIEACLPLEHTSVPVKLNNQRKSDLPGNCYGTNCNHLIINRSNLLKAINMKIRKDNDFSIGYHGGSPATIFKVLETTNNKCYYKKLGGY